MSRNSKLILSKNIKLDKEYKEVLNYTELEMLTLMTDNTHFVNRNDTFSFLRENENVISTQFSYAECLQSTYIAFTNPNYADKWFFAFVDDVVYKSDKNIEIHFTIDVMTTWFNKVTPKQCFVVREHTMDDTKGNNTQPEDLELGEYCINQREDLAGAGYDEYDICIGVSVVDPNLSLSTTVLTSRIYNGIYSGLRYFIFDSESDASNFIREYDNQGKAGAIYTIFLVPKALITTTTTIFYDNVTFGDYTIRIGVYQPSNTCAVLTAFSDVIQPTDLNGYTPKNNKLYTYPYSYIYLTNNCGGSVTYNWEDFDGSPDFSCDGALCIGCSIKLYPRNYKKYPTSTVYKRVCYSYGLNCGKYPTCSWNSDSFTNWITQNAVNIALDTAKVGASAIAGVATAGTSTALQTASIGAGLSLGTSIGGTLAQMYQHSLVPNQAMGDVNSGDISTSSGQLGFWMLKMCIKYENAKKIDEYFTRFGYKTNLTKVPNINGRTYFNYVQIADSEVIGYGEVPNKYMDEINRIFRTGVTIWHDHSKIGDYTVNNAIVTP